VSSPPDFNVVIAGAGFVGAALGLGLAHQGLKVLVVDQLPPPGQGSDDGRGLALNMSSVAVLDALALWSQLAPLVYPIKHIHVTQQGHFGAVRLSHRDLALPALGYVCPAQELQRVLRMALAAAPEITLHWSTSLVAVQADDMALRLTLRSAGDSANCTTSLLVGADGIDSAVRELAGIGVRRHAYGQTAIVSNVDVAQPRAHTAFERFTTSGPLALLPLGPRRHVLVRTAPTDAVPGLLALPDAAYLADAMQRCGRTPGAFSNLGPRRAHPLVLQRAAQVTGRRSLLLGNAANTLHPNAAQGLNLGLRDVAGALETLARARDAGEDLGSAEVLQRYARAREHDQRTTTQITDTLARVFAHASPALGSLRALAMIGADRLPWIKRLALRRLVLGQGLLS
jgi:2-octaprenyl-6-methoxyphenol hydroxylase